MATVDDAMLLDALVMAHLTLSLGIRTPRERLTATERRKLERGCDESERRFMHVRECVRDCPTFSALRRADREVIVGVLFDPF